VVKQSNQSKRLAAVPDKVRERALVAWIKGVVTKVLVTDDASLARAVRRPPRVQGEPRPLRQGPGDDPGRAPARHHVRRGGQDGPAPSQLQLVSCVSGVPAGANVSTPDYWIKHIRAPVLFAPAVSMLPALAINTFLELGPAPVLISMAARILPGEWFLASLPRAGGDSNQALLATVAACSAPAAPPSPGAAWTPPAPSGASQTCPPTPSSSARTGSRPAVPPSPTRPPGCGASQAPSALPHRRAEGAVGREG